MNPKPVALSAHKNATIQLIPYTNLIGMHQYVIFCRRPLNIKSGDLLCSEPHDELVCVCSKVENEAHMYAALMNFKAFADDLSSLDESDPFDKSYTKSLFPGLIKILELMINNYLEIPSEDYYDKSIELVQSSCKTFFIPDRKYFYVRKIPCLLSNTRYQQLVQADFDTEIYKIEFMLHKLLNHQAIIETCAYDKTQVESIRVALQARKCKSMEIRDLLDNYSQVD